MFEEVCHANYLLPLIAGCIQWLPDITMFTQGSQRMCNRYDTKWHVSQYQVIHS